MIKCRRIVALFMVIAISVFALPFTVAAEGDNAEKYPVGTVLKYNFNLQVPEKVENFQGALSYTSESLKLVSYTFTDVDGVFENPDETAGKVYFCGTSFSNPYDYTEKKVFCTAEFQVTGTSEVDAHIDWEYLVGSDPTGNKGTKYVYNSIKVNDFVFEADKSVSVTKILRFAGTSITLQNNLQMQYYVDRKFFDSAGFTNPYISVDFNGKTYKVTDYTSSGSYYVFKFSNIAPHLLTDDTRAVVCGEYNGTVYSSKVTRFNVSDYCYTVLNDTNNQSNTKLLRLMVDLLDYGTKSQIYIGHNLDNLADSKLTEEQKNYGTQSNPEVSSVATLKYETIDAPTAKFQLAGLTLRDVVSVTFRFSAPEVNENYNVKIKAGSKTEVVPYSSFVPNGSSFDIKFSDFATFQSREPIYATIYDGDVAVSNTMRYSIESYADTYKSVSGKLTDLLMSLMKYSDSALNYIS